MDVDVAAAAVRVDLPSAPLQSRMSFGVKVQIPNLLVHRSFVKTRIRHTWPFMSFCLHSIYYILHHAFLPVSVFKCIRLNRFLTYTCTHSMSANHCCLSI